MIPFKRCNCYLLVSTGTSSRTICCWTAMVAESFSNLFVFVYDFFFFFCLCEYVAERFSFRSYPFDWLQYCHLATWRKNRCLSQWNTSLYGYVTHVVILQLFLVHLSGWFHWCSYADYISSTWSVCNRGRKMHGLFIRSWLVELGCDAVRDDERKSEFCCFKSIFFYSG